MFFLFITYAEDAATIQTSIELNNILHVCFRALYTCGILLQPAVPNISSRLLDRLGVPVDGRLPDNLLDWKVFTGVEPLRSPAWGGHSLGNDVGMLFPKIK